MLCEKPLSVNATEVARMIQSAKDHNALLMEAMKSHYFQLDKVRDEIGLVFQSDHK